MAFTFFFRDAQTLELLIEQALPALRGQSQIHVWDAGCANGAEPYTLAMLLRERMSAFTFNNVRIHATDVDPTFRAQVLEGIYSEQEVKRIPDAIRERYFRSAGPSDHAQVQVIDEIRSKVSFAQHDLLSFSPPRENFSLVVCKNVLLHFGDEERRRVLRMFHGAMRHGGLLATENTQELPQSLESLFEPISSFARVYRRSDAATSVGPHIDGPLTFVERLRRKLFGVQRV